MHFTSKIEFSNPKDGICIHRIAICLIHDDLSPLIHVSGKKPVI